MMQSLHSITAYFQHSNSRQKSCLADVATHMAYVAQQQLDGYDAAVQHAIKRKTAFDKRVLERKPGEVIFYTGQLVQFYRSSMDYTFEAKRKLLPKWSPPHRITTRICNSYKIETLQGERVAGEYHARRLRAFIPREGTKLAEDQKVFEESIARRKESREGVSDEEETSNEKDSRDEGEDQEEEDQEEEDQEESAYRGEDAE